MSTGRQSLGRLPAMARAAIEARFAGRSYVPEPLPDDVDRPHGVFVTLHERGELRGCIGHIEPTCDRLSDEVVAVAPLAAFRDPRFPPLAESELPEIDVEVSVLTPPEPVHDRGQLDAKRYGVVVTAGWRRGVLLPDLDGVDTVEQQLSIALRKGGISPHEAYAIERFEVIKLEEAP